MGNSQALIADAGDSMSDLLTDFLVLFGLRWGRKMADDDHPFGHARIETLSTLVVGLVLIAASLGIAYNAISAIYQHRVANPGVLGITVAALSIVVKEGMYRYAVKVGRRIRSLALIGNAWHYRSDALSSLVVLVGVTAVYLNPDWHMADAYAALIVTFLIFWVGGGLVWRSVREMVDTAPDRRVLLQMSATASLVPGVIEVHDIRARHVGAQIQVEMHIVVDPEQSVREGHAIAKQVETRLIEEMSDIERVIIHVDPEPKREL
jgi:cation diffusion facilitator family transporter